jgi:hypothetical protein
VWLEQSEGGREEEGKTERNVLLETFYTFLLDAVFVLGTVLAL